MQANQFVVALKRLANGILRTDSLDAYGKDMQTSILSWREIEKRHSPPLWDDPIMALVANFDCSQVRIGNFVFKAPSGKPFIGDMFEFLTGPRDYYVGSGRHDVHQFYYKEAWPTDMGVESEAFLKGLLFYAEYLTGRKKGLSPEAREALEKRYPPLIKNAPFHPLRRKDNSPRDDLA